MTEQWVHTLNAGEFLPGDPIHWTDRTRNRRMTGTVKRADPMHLRVLVVNAKELKPKATP